MLAKVVFRGMMQWHTSHVVVNGEYLSQDSQINILSDATLLGANRGFSTRRLAVSTRESFQEILQHGGLSGMAVFGIAQLIPTLI
jgi:hypothetical protein